MIREMDFSLERQMRFADLSGDRNPIHIDLVMARRMLPARLVVHGIHIVLWLLDMIATSCSCGHSISRINARFLRFTYVGDKAVAVIIKDDAERIDIQVISNDVLRAEVRIIYGPARAMPANIDPVEAYLPAAGPLDHQNKSIDARRGVIAVLTPAGRLAAEFPKACRWIGSERADALAAASRLVGMIYPGLHSVLGGFDLRTMPLNGAGGLSFEMGELRHEQIDATISGGGIVGMLDCRVPNSPVLQPRCAELRHMVVSNCFNGARVIVIGGARGVGEASAKLLALGGAELLITYRQGRADADAVAADIAAAGGRCSTAHYDSDRPDYAPLLAFAPTHACWFATPTMMRPDVVSIDAAWLSECMAVLAIGFFDFAKVLKRDVPKIRLLYPSMDAIDIIPSAGLAEYMMAKAAAEVAIRSLDRLGAPGCIIAPRLPPMATDQTARRGILGRDAANTMLPHLNQLLELA